MKSVPALFVLSGCLLAAAIYWSLGQDDAAADKAGARRVAAAIGARATSQPVLAASARLSARRALQGLYGNYDPVLDGAYWTITGAPKPLAGWNGKTVVIKPLNGNQGKGVAIGLQDAAGVRAAFAQAQEHSSSVIVEAFQPGHDYRILVVNGRTAAVAQRVPGHVVGDGRRTVGSLA